MRTSQRSPCGAPLPVGVSDIPITQDSHSQFGTYPCDHPLVAHSVFPPTSTSAVEVQEDGMLRSIALTKRASSVSHASNSFHSPNRNSPVFLGTKPQMRSNALSSAAFLSSRPVQIQTCCQRQSRQDHVRAASRPRGNIDLQLQCANHRHSKQRDLPARLGGILIAFLPR